MNWREIRQSKEFFKYSRAIWRAEKAMPKWFRNSSLAWTRNYKEFEKWARSCQEIFGLFDDEGNLYFCVYIERQTVPEVAIIHLSIIRKLKPSVFVIHAEILRDLLFKRGVLYIRGWLLKKNTALCLLLTRIGFLDTELQMKFGKSHGSIFRWRMVEVRRAA